MHIESLSPLVRFWTTFGCLPSVADGSVGELYLHPDSGGLLRMSIRSCCFVLQGGFPEAPNRCDRSGRARNLQAQSDRTRRCRGSRTLSPSRYSPCSCRHPRLRGGHRRGCSRQAVRFHPGFRDAQSRSARMFGAPSALFYRLHGGWCAPSVPANADGHGWVPRGKNELPTPTGSSVNACGKTLSATSRWGFLSVAW